MAKAKTVVMNPPAVLEEREGDVAVDDPNRYLSLSLFANLKSKPSVEKFPGTLALRHFRKGEVICRQGEAGWTAFYALNAADVAALRADGLVREGPGPLPAGAEPAVATVHLALARERPRQGQGGWGGLLGWFRGGGPRPARPRFIPIDAPRDVDYDTRQATLFEEDLFGEMSCMNGSPRSGTIVADRDWFMLEMLRNILDGVWSDRNYQEKMDQKYRTRVLQNHLRRLSIFSDLTDEQFSKVRDKVELVRFKVGEVICTENERADSLYLIRSGLVKVVKNATALLAVGDVVDFPGLVARLAQASAEPNGALGRIWNALPGAAREIAERGPASDEDRQELIHGLNDVIKAAPLPDLKAAAGQEELAGSPALAELVGGLPKDPKAWPEEQRGRVGRLLVEAACPGCVRPLVSQLGMEYVLTYLSHGDSFGEMGLLMRRPRSATCVAYVHPDPGQGHKVPAAPWRRKEEMVEAVRISAADFWTLVGESDAARRELEALTAQRRRRDEKTLARPVWASGGDVQASPQFEKEGLIQGQRLMLIDLDRCTRCDECVRACVATHDDGHSRLFLDGPRFGKYLVPTTCRSCLDPVCLIGCPVGSIHRGENRQIIIENWCIGCSLCATNCPYGSIQMHDVGVIAEEAHGWRYAPAAFAGPRWVEPRFDDRRWLAGRSPFRNDVDLRAGLQTLAGSEAATAAVCFRHAFEVSADVVRSAAGFRLEVTSTDGPLGVWVNGHKREPAGPAKRGKREYAIDRDAQALRPGRNVLAVEATPGAEGGVLLEARLDEVRKPDAPEGFVGEISEKVVEFRAVVCDLCSGQFGQRPACVTACPHDAALRVNARHDFPAQSR